MAHPQVIRMGRPPLEWHRKVTGPPLSTGVVYKIKSKDCEEVYIGQTSRALRSRTIEHKRAVYTGDKNSLLAQHCLQNNHEFPFDDEKIINRCSQWSRRLFLEAWHH